MFCAGADFFLIFEARQQRMKRQLDDAIATFTRIAETPVGTFHTSLNHLQLWQNGAPYFQLMCYFELSWGHIAKHEACVCCAVISSQCEQWAAALPCAHKLLELSEWSKPVSWYLIAICHHNAGDTKLALEVRLHHVHHTSHSPQSIAAAKEIHISRKSKDKPPAVCESVVRSIAH